MPIGSEIEKKSEDHSKNESKSLEFHLTDPKFTFSELIISQSSLSDINSLINLQKNLKFIAEDMGFKDTHDLSDSFILNLYGPPGTGKTSIAHAIANKLGKKILSVDYSEIESKYVGDTPKNLKRVFEFASNSDDCIIFFDEADAMLSKRVTNMSSSTDTSVNQTRSVLLNILNDFKGYLIFATNFVSNYDPAFMRRINRHIYIGLPDKEARHKLFERYIPKKYHSGIEFPILSAESEEMSPADIKKSTLLAAYSAVENNNFIINNDIIIKEISKIKQSKKANSSTTETFTRTLSKEEASQLIKQENK